MKKPKPPILPIERVLQEIQRTLKQHQDLDLTTMSMAELVRVIFETSPRQLGTRDVALAIHKLTTRMPSIENIVRAIQRLVIYGKVEAVGKEPRLASDGVIHHIQMYRRKTP